MNKILSLFLSLLFFSNAYAQTYPSPTFNTLTLQTPLSASNGGTGATSASAALTALGAAKNGVNSDITSLTALTTPLPSSEGGTGVSNTTSGATLTYNSPVTFNGSSTPSLQINYSGTTTLTFPSTGTLLATTGNGSGLTGLTLSQFPSIAANTLLGALTSTYPQALSVPSCSASTSALIWTSGTGFGCNTVANNSTFAAPPSIGSTTPANGSFTTLSSTLLGHLDTTGTPVINTNNCGSTTQGVITEGNNQYFEVTVGTASVTSCQITFSSSFSWTPRTAELTPANSAAAAVGTVDAYISALSTSSVTISGTNLSSAAYYVEIN